ncbi:hypothetical protein GJ496_004009 [Pomphorhynchus laevis]|nr:hypothetical protein GJ496_004009 [Pomphorhynchus laevis]
MLQHWEINESRPEDSYNFRWTDCIKCFQFGTDHDFANVRIKRCGSKHCISVKYNKEFKENLTKTEYDFNKCGVRKCNSQLRTITKLRSDQLCRKGECPWLVKININISTDLNSLCSGAIIHPQWILTAAHCLVGSYLKHGISYIEPSNLSLSYGGSNSIGESVEKYIINPNMSLFHTGSPMNDIALIKLRKPINFDEYTNAACLPSQDMEVPYDTLCIVAGWGKTNEMSVTPTKYARKSVNKVINNSDCVLIPTELKPLPLNKICAQNEEGKSICEGDSGTPLACEGSVIPANDSNVNSTVQAVYKWYIFGVASYGGGRCDETNKQNIFAKVATEVDWILSMINKF